MMAEETNVATNNESTEQSEPEKLFTQADMDDALAKERANRPSEDELEGYRKWQESQKTEQERQEQILDERNSARQRVSELESELEQARRERLLLSKGVPEDDLDYYAYKIGKRVTDSVPFEKAAEQFIKERSKASSGKVVASFGVSMPSHAPQGESLNERINRQLRGGK